MFRRNFLRTGISISFALFFICPIYSNHIIGTELNYELISSDPNNFSINLFINSTLNCQLNSCRPQRFLDVFLCENVQIFVEFIGKESKDKQVVYLHDILFVCVLPIALPYKPIPLSEHSVCHC